MIEIKTDQQATFNKLSVKIDFADYNELLQTKKSIILPYNV